MAKTAFSRPAPPNYVTVYDDSGKVDRHSREVITAGFCGVYCGEYLATMYSELSSADYKVRFQSMYEYIYPSQKERADMVPPWVTLAELNSFALTFNRPYMPEWDDDPEWDAAP